MSKLFHPVVCILVRLVLGGTIVYASFHKILDPGDFKHIVFNYELFPSSLINILTIYMPWLEAIVGTALITGVGRRGAGIICGCLFVSFIVILAYNLSRDCPTICGCFSTFADDITLTAEQKFAKMHREIWLVDVPSLIGAVHVILASLRAKKA